MKSFLILILWFTTQVATFGGDDVNGLNVAKVVTAARELFAATRSSVGSSVEETLKRKTIALKDLDAILTVLDSESNKLQKATFIGKLDLAARQVETVRTQSAALLKDPANKAMAEGMDLQRWLDEISRQRSVREILESDMARLRGTIQELRRWAALLEPVAPPDQVASKLKSRLAELLNEWRNARSATPGTGQMPGKAESQTDDRVEPATAEPSAEAQTMKDAGAINAPPQPLVQIQFVGPDGSVHKTVTASPGVVAVIKMAVTGTAEGQILKFIDRNDSPFTLTADQIVAIRDMVSSRMISAMIHRDAVLRANATSRRKL